MLGPGAALVATGLLVGGVGLGATGIAAAFGAGNDDFKPFGIDFQEALS